MFGICTDTLPPYQSLAGEVVHHMNEIILCHTLGQIDESQVEALIVPIYHYLNNAVSSTYMPMSKDLQWVWIEAVSYTHLTLPTKRIV